MYKTIFFAVGAFVCLGGVASGFIYTSNESAPGASLSSSKHIHQTSSQHAQHQHSPKNITQSTGETHSASHAGHHYLKPGADILNVNDHSYVLDVHEHKEIELELRVEQTMGVAEVHIEMDDGLVLVSAQADWRYTIDRRQTLKVPLTIYGATEGKHYVHIFTTFTDEYGQVSSRALAQQVNVGDVPLQAKFYKSATALPKPYTQLPVNERIY